MRAGCVAAPVAATLAATIAATIAETVAQLSQGRVGLFRSYRLSCR